MFAGDPSQRGPLFALITDEKIRIEPKGYEAYSVYNNLHIIMSTNMDFAVPALSKGRRFFVLNVSDHKRVDLDALAGQGAEVVFHAHDYFAKIVKQQDDGGREAFLYDMLHMKLGQFNVRAVPITDAMKEQKELGLTGFDRWWMEVLDREYVLHSKYGCDAELHVWKEFVSSALAYESYTRWYTQSRERRERQMSKNMMGRYLIKLGYEKGHNDQAIIKEVSGFGGGDVLRSGSAHVRGYWVGNIEGARTKFDAKVGIKRD
jgi:hypothetical protein